MTLYSDEICFFWTSYPAGKLFPAGHFIFATSLFVFELIIVSLSSFTWLSNERQNWRWKLSVCVRSFDHLIQLFIPRDLVPRSALLNGLGARERSGIVPVLTGFIQDSGHPRSWFLIIACRTLGVLRTALAVFQTVLAVFHAILAVFWTNLAVLWTIW